MPDPAKRRDLVLDTSVWINLLATETLPDILAAFGGSYYTPEQVVSEITRHPVTNIQFTAEAHPFRSRPPPASIVVLSQKELELFLDIVGGPATSALGDGEAAAISVAVVRGFALAIDDRKARRIIRERFSHIETFWTADILSDPLVKTVLGAHLAEECWRKAKQFGRMHVPRTK